MTKLLRLKDFILLSAAITSDILGETHNGFGILPEVYKSTYGYAPSRYKNSSFTSAVSELQATNDINKVIDKEGNVLLELSSKGKREFKKLYALFTQKKKWDGYFMVVIYDIPEKRNTIRVGLREKLKGLGFGMLQKSVWISPYHFEDDMREFLGENGLNDVVFVLAARKLWMGNPKILAEKLWNISRVNGEYMKIVELLDNNENVSERKKKVVLDKAEELYFKSLRNDPMLPVEFLPENWARKKALNCLNSVLKGTV